MENAVRALEEAAAKATPAPVQSGGGAAAVPAPGYPVVIPPVPCPHDRRKQRRAEGCREHRVPAAALPGCRAVSAAKQCCSRCCCSGSVQQRSLQLCHAGEAVPRERTDNGGGAGSGKGGADWFCGRTESAIGASRLGDLPCPDRDDDGDADAVPGCDTAALALGRLPWKTLGLPDLRDGDGERLWSQFKHLQEQYPDILRQSGRCRLPE